MWVRWLKRLSISIAAITFGTGLIGVAQCSAADESSCNDCSGFVSDGQLYPRLDRSPEYYRSQLRYSSGGGSYETVVIRDRSYQFDTLGTDSFNTTFAQPPVPPSNVVVRNWSDPLAPDYSPGTALRSSNPDWRVAPPDQAIPTYYGSYDSCACSRNGDEVTTRSTIRMAPGTMSGEGSGYPYVEQRERPLPAGIEAPNVGTGNSVTPVLNLGPIEGETMGVKGEGSEATGQAETYGSRRGGGTSDNATNSSAIGERVINGRGMPAGSGAVDSTGRAPGTINTSAGWTRTEGSNSSGTTPGGVMNGQQVPQQ